MEELDINNVNSVDYSDAKIVHLEGLEAVRVRPGMYIGKLGDGSQSDDGIYILFKEVIDNCIDEFRMKFGNKIDITADKTTITVRDYGRGIPQGAMVKAVSELHTGGKFDSEVFQKSVGMNGVGLKAVNALSSNFIVRSFREGKVKEVRFEKGVLLSETKLLPTTEQNGTYIEFTPDNSFGIFENYSINIEFLETMLRNYSYLNTGLVFNLNDKKFFSKNGLWDLLDESITAEPLYPIVHLKGEDIEIAFTHINQSREEYYSFVNGQHTIDGGTHQSAFKEIFAKTVKEFYGKNMEYADIRSGLVAAIYVAVQEPVFESQTKRKLNSPKINSKDPNSTTVLKFMGDFAIKEIDNFLHKNPIVADILLKKIQESEKERKAIATVTKTDKKRAQKIDMHNPKLRDCRTHFNDARGKDEDKDETCIFITEGDSASGSITKTRNANFQAVFSLRGKPLNSYGETKQIVYKNMEFNLLQAALNIEDGLDGLRYNKVIIATDADVDGMHIRLLLMTFFLQFFPDLIKKGHVYILQTPLFRVRNKKDTFYCYSEEEREEAIKKLGANPEITRFKGLGEINPDEFKTFIGKDMRLDRITLRKEDAVADMLGFYMGKNTRERQEFIVENLNIEAE
ncbi:MAG: type IIA DNA topoisomerase subunit B [Prevotellaceae bacterium]|jgi:topoisomerase-4 subunit B|nr:type IIA DNA topoisomerase subunit B [Prevotellaceae bacterium]